MMGFNKDSIARIRTMFADGISIAEIAKTLKIKEYFIRAICRQ